MNETKHSGRIAGLLIALALLLVSPPSVGLQMTGLYDHRVAVANESDAERNRAIREAMEAVFLKVTGEARWLEHPALLQAVRNAQSYVEAISYASETVAVIPEPQAADQQTAAAADQPSQDEALLPTLSLPATRQQRYINVSFADSLLNTLLASAEIPVWDSNRPSVLIWMALQDAAGTRSVLTADVNPQIIELMQAFGVERGLPIIFPVLDFEDRRTLSEDALWALDEDAIRSASARYGADSILTGRLHFTASGEIVGLWQFIFRGQAEVFDGFDDDLAAYLNAPLNRITNQLAGYFAIVPESASEQLVRLRVEGIKDLSAYSALLNYVRNLRMVQSVNTAELDGERLELQLALLGDAQQLFELIALDRDLLPIASSQREAQSVLHYRWTR